MTEYQENKIRKTMSSFGGVWQRVTGGEAPEPRETIPRHEAGIRDLLREEKLAAASDARLARRLPNPAGEVLYRHAAAARRRVRRLRAEYFILEGQCDETVSRAGEVRDCLQALRCAYRRDLAQAEAYSAAAARGDSQELRELYRRSAAELERAACEKRALIVGFFSRSGRRPAH